MGWFEDSAEPTAKGDGWKVAAPDGGVWWKQTRHGWMWGSWSRRGSAFDLDSAEFGETRHWNRRGNVVFAETKAEAVREARARYEAAMDAPFDDLDGGEPFEMPEKPLRLSDFFVEIKAPPGASPRARNGMLECCGWPPHVGHEAGCAGAEEPPVERPVEPAGGCPHCGLENLGCLLCNELIGDGEWAFGPDPRSAGFGHLHDRCVAAARLEQERKRRDELRKASPAPRPRRNRWGLAAGGAS